MKTISIKDIKDLKGVDKESLIKSIKEKEELKDKTVKK